MLIAGIYSHPEGLASFLELISLCASSFHESSAPVPPGHRSYQLMVNPQAEIRATSTHPVLHGQWCSKFDSQVVPIRHFSQPCCCEGAERMGRPCGEVNSAGVEEEEVEDGAAQKTRGQMDNELERAYPRHSWLVLFRVFSLGWTLFSFTEPLQIQGDFVSITIFPTMESQRPQLHFKQHFKLKVLDKNMNILKIHGALVQSKNYRI